MGRYSNMNIIELLESAGYFGAAEYLKRVLHREFTFGFGHKKVLILLYILGAFDKRIRVPQRPSSENPDQKITDPRAFWQAIEWLYEGAANSFKARYQELKVNTEFVISGSDGEYGISAAGVQRVIELLTYERRCRDFASDVVQKLFFDNSNRANFLRHILWKTGNYHPMPKEKLCRVIPEVRVL